MLVKKKGWGKFLAMALVFTFLFQCIGMIVPGPASAATTELTITKYAVDGTTVLAQKTVNYQWLANPDNIPVMGDGETHYYHQGPVFKDDSDPDEQERLRWNEEEDQNWDTKDMGALKGTNVKDLCKLVGDMSEGDSLEVKSTDGFKKTFAYKNVYQYNPDREGPMVVSWYKDGKYPDTGYTDGMRLVWFAGATYKEGPTSIEALPSGNYHVFGNWDWHEAADPQYWYYYNLQYPTTTGLSAQVVSELNIFSNDPVPPPAPILQSGEVTTQGDVSLTFDQDIADPTGIGAESQFEVLVDGQNTVVDSVVKTNTSNKIKLEMATEIKGGQEVTAAYTKGSDDSKQIKSLDGGVLQSFTAFSVTNPLTTLDPPALSADSSDNQVGQAIDITFTDDADWRAGITGITVNGSALTGAQYEVTEGNINLADDVFTAAGDYEVSVKAPGYSNATVTQSVVAASPIALTVDGNVVGTPITYTLAELQAMPVSSVVNSGKTYAGVAVDYLLSTLGTAEDDWIVTIKTKDLAPLNLSNYNDPIFAYERDGEAFADAYSGETTYLRLANETSNMKYVYGMTVSEAASAQVPNSAFTADKTSGDAPLSVQFTDQSTNEPTSWAWDFNNDGTVDSTQQNPAYAFDSAGTYTVKLTATNSAGSDEETKTDYITVTEAGPHTWYVDDSGGADFSQIHDAVTAAKAGDTIIVKDGTYTENIVVDKSMVIQSENGAEQTIVQAVSTTVDVFNITAGNVTIDGFTVSGASSTDKSGIAISGTSTGYCNIINNQCSGNGQGIAIKGLSSNNQNINNTVANNSCSASGKYGIYLSNTSGNLANNNNFSNNPGPEYSGYGICLFDNANNNTFSGNMADSNNMGIRVKNADNNTIINNTFSNNNIGMEIATGPVGNVFYLNNFVENTTQLSAGYGAVAGNIWNTATDQTYTYKGSQYSNQLGNYWSNYTGVDADNNGIGDTAFTTILTDNDNYPLMGAWQDGVITAPPVAVTSVSISEGDQELELGQTVQLNAIVLPEDASNKNISWSSNDEAIATVSENGLVTGVAVGSTSITVTTEDGNFSHSITINSLPVEPQISLYCNSGIPGASLFMAGRGFDAEVAGTIWFDTNDDGILDQDESSIAVVTDQHGTIPLLASISVPSVDTGDYSIRADIGDSKVSVPFNVTDTGIIVSPISGNGQAVDPRYITVTGTGLPASASYRLFVDRNGNGIFDDGAYKSGTTAADSTLNINNLSWPSSPAGIYNILLDIGKDDTIEAAASVGVVPGLKITTPRGVPGTNIGMTLVGFSANADGYVWFDANGNEVWDEDENKAAVTTTTAGGASSPGLYVPSAPPGLYQVLADIPACGLKANSVTYSIAGLVLNPDSGIVGSSIDVTGYGLVTNQTGKYIWFDSNDDGTWNEDEPKVDVSTDASCTISPVSITVPEVPAGTYNVRTTVAPNTMFAVFTVNAPPSIPVTGVSITEGNQELDTGQTVQLTAVVEPENATNKNVSWSSNDEAIATVSENGLVTTVAEGTVTITVTTEDGNKTDSITVTVVDSSGPSIDVLYEGTVILTPGETFTVSVGSTEYTIDDNTPLGALQAAASSESFSYAVTDKKYLDSGILLLNDIGSYPYVKSGSEWYAYVNDVYKDGYSNPADGLNLFELEDGDKVEFYYANIDSSDISAVKAAATAAVKTVVALSTLDVLYDGTVNLDPQEDFTVTAHNSSVEYTVNQNTPLGALQAAATAAAPSFTYDVTDKNYTTSGALLLDNVGDYDYVKGGSAWYAYVNEIYKDGYNNAAGALNLIQLVDGDKVEFYYAANISDATDLNAVKAAAAAAVKTIVANGVAPTDWTLQLFGAKNETVTKDYFEQGLACPSSGHQVSWTDDKGTPEDTSDDEVWGGIPLWLLVAMVDDDPDVGDYHYNFNDELADEGYEVKVIAGDGWDTTLSSADIAGSDAYIVANTLNGEPLPLKIGDKNKDCWPLYLKGSAISGGQQVGNIVRIELSGLPEPPAGWTLEMVGEIGDTITQQEFEEALACTGSGHLQEWTDNEGKVWSGVPLWVLLGAIDNIESGSHWNFDDTLAANYSVKVTNGDGDYSKTFAGSDLANSNDYIVANIYDGAPLAEGSAPLRLVGDGVTKDDGSLGGLAVGNIARIEIPELQTPPAADGSWNLTLDGIISDVIPQAEFEAGLACPNSGHLVEWTDGEGNEWSGIPLWYLAGWVDDRQPHAYDFNQAVAGYKVVVKASDGYSVDFDSADINQSSDYIIANQCNGSALDGSWPLRLVGAGVANTEGALTGKSVGKVAEIKLTSFESGSGGDIPQVHIVKYAEDNTTILNEITVDYLWMQNESGLDVIGDGTTVYKYEGITNNAADIWDAAETYPGGYKIANAVKGTRIKDLVELVGGMGAGTDIVFKAKDGWETKLPYSSIYTDPSVQARQGDAILAWYADGNYVPDYADGMRLFFTPDDHIYGQWDMHETLAEPYWHYYYGDVMYPSCAGLSPKYITEINVYSVPVNDWTLKLDGGDIGGLVKDISKTYFESALTCTMGANHLASYTDSQNRVWEGMPLWFLVGFVDDQDQHSDNAFNESLAQAGYQVVITAADNSSITIDSTEITRSANYIVANSLNGVTLPDTDSSWPLRLVGPAVTGSTSIKQIVSIELMLTPPNLTADSVDNRVGQAIDISFNDDADWRTAITTVKVDGNALSAGQYAVSEGKITIMSGVFPTARDYTVLISAEGYEDVEVIQVILADTPGNPVYTISPVADNNYINGTTVDGINTMTVKTGVSGFRYFTIDITPVTPHTGQETVVFTHLRNGVQLGINASRADFDLVSSAQAGFNVKAGDVIKAYIVDELTNDLSVNPIILQ